MKRSSLSQQAAVLLALLPSLAIASGSRYVVHGRIHGGGARLRGNPTPSNIERRMEGDGDEESGDSNDEESGDNDNGQEEEAADDAAQRYYQDDAIQSYYDVYDDNFEGNNDDEGGWAYTTYKSTVQNYASNATANAWLLYESPPSEWTNHQWDIMFGLLFAFLACSCGGVACFAFFCCSNGDNVIIDDIDILDMEPLSPKKKRRNQLPSAARSAARSVKSGARSAAKSAAQKYHGHRNKFADDQYKLYQGANEEDETVLKLPEQTPRAYDEKEEDGLTVDTDAELSNYEPPDIMTPTSLADYTSVQREKEARLLELWKEEQLMQHGYLAAADDASDTALAEVGSRQVIPCNDDWRKDAYDNSSPNDYSGNDDWVKEVDGNPNPYPQPSTTKKTASDELDIAVHQNSSSKRNSGGKGEDKLLEARDRQHNFVGYYL